MADLKVKVETKDKENQRCSFYGSLKSPGELTVAPLLRVPQASRRRCQQSCHHSAGCGFFTSKGLYASWLRPLSFLMLLATSPPGLKNKGKKKPALLQRRFVTRLSRLQHRRVLFIPLLVENQQKNLQQLDQEISARIAFVESEYTCKGVDT